MTDLRYPIGDFEKPASVTASQRAANIKDIDEAPGKVKAAIAGLAPIVMELAAAGDETARRIFESESLELARTAVGAVIQGGQNSFRSLAMSTGPEKCFFTSSAQVE